MVLLCDLCSNTRLISIRPASIFQTGSPRNPSATTASAAERRNASPPRSRSALETRISLVLALASQASSVSQRLFVTVLDDLAKETAKYAFPRRFEARNLEEALMTVPDLETVKFRVLKRTEQYEIREVEV